MISSPTVVGSATKALTLGEFHTVCLRFFGIRGGCKISRLIFIQSLSLWERWHAIA